MLTPADLVRLPYSPDLTLAGIAYACRRLACSGLTETQITYISLRDQVTYGAANLAFLRFLSSEQVPHSVHGSIPYYDPSSYTIHLGSHRCVLQSSLIIDRETIHRIRRNPGEIFERHAQIEVTDLECETQSKDDLLLFTLALGVVTRRPSELEKATDAGQPVSLIHTLPIQWSNPDPGSQLNEIALKSNHSQEVKLEAGGRDLDGLFSEQTIMLPPRVRTTLTRPYQSLAYLHSDRLVSYQLGLSASGLPDTWIIQPGQWGNIWVYGLDIFLIGYLTRDEFRQRGTLQQPEDTKPPWIYGKKKVLTFGRLHPLAGLFEWARKA